jgi:hypothetical protein
MKRLISAPVLLLAMLLLFTGCSRSKLAGTWTNPKTGSTMEFKSDKTGVIHQKSQGALPAGLNFTWKMVNQQEFSVSVTVPGYAEPVQGRGKLDGNTLVLENDTFTRTGTEK